MLVEERGCPVQLRHPDIALDAPITASPFLELHSPWLRARTMCIAQVAW